MPPILYPIALYPASHHRTNAVGELVRLGCGLADRAVAEFEVIHADSGPEARGRICLRKSPPRIVYREDASVGIEQGDLSGQGVENGGLLGGILVTQVLLGTPQHNRSTVTVCHRVDLACGQHLQTLLGPMERRD